MLQAEQLPKLDLWLRCVLWDCKLPSLIPGSPEKKSDERQLEIHRLKARLPFNNGDVKIVQGVREVFDIFDVARSGSADDPSLSEGKIVLIGRQVTAHDFKQSFLNTIKL